MRPFIRLTRIDELRELACTVDDRSQSHFIVAPDGAVGGLFVSNEALPTRSRWRVHVHAASEDLRVDGVVAWTRCHGEERGSAILFDERSPTLRSLLDRACGPTHDEDGRLSLAR